MKQPLVSPRRLRKRASMNDEDLIAAYYACDENVWQELYRRHWGRLVAFLRRFVQQADAEDVVGEAFMRVARTKTTGSRFDPARGVPFRGWLDRIVWNCLNDHRRRSGQAIVLPADLMDNLPAPTQTEEVVEPSSAEVVAAGQVVGPLRTCLDELTEALREVVLLDLHGLSLTEIGERLGINYGTAGNRLHRGRQHLRECLRGQGLRFVPRGSELPPGTRVAMTLANETLIQIDAAECRRHGYELVASVIELRVGDRVVLVFPEEGQVLVLRADRGRRES